MSSFLDGQWHEGSTRLPVHDAYSGERFAEVGVPSAARLDRALATLAGEPPGGGLPADRRGAILRRAAALVEERRERFVDTLVTETGFTTREAHGEVTRAAGTLKLSGEEAERLAGGVVPLGGDPRGRGRLGFTVHRPVGTVCAITPFNSPLNTVAHKLGPALAAGNSLVLKPAPQTPLTAVLLVETVLDAGQPPGSLVLVHGGADVGRQLVSDRRIAYYAFTGSTTVGETIAATVGLRRTQLELGSIASTIVCADADLGAAVERCVPAAFRKAGQVCTSIQRLHVAESVVDEVIERLAAALEGRRAGDPRDEASFIGPLINSPEADRVHRWVEEAAIAGAQVVCGGEHDGSLHEPTVLTRVGPGMRVHDEEVFGPVVSVLPFRSLAEVVAQVNATPYGLAAGIFTRDIGTALAAAEELHVGAAHVNETSNSRIDLMPYGGVKRSGWGTEGPVHAIREMSEERLVTIRYD